MTEKPKDILPIAVPKETTLKRGDKFTMDVPCDPVTGCLSGAKNAVLKTRKFEVIKVV